MPVRATPLNAPLVFPGSQTTALQVDYAPSYSCQWNPAPPGYSQDPGLSSTRFPPFTSKERLLSIYYVPGPVLRKRFTNVSTSLEQPTL